MTLDTLPTQPPLPPMTEEEFEAWCDEDTRAEFVDGKVILMSPVDVRHNKINNFLVKLLDLYLEMRPGGTMLGPEYMVRLRSGLRRVPDLLYVASQNEARIRRTYLDGAPDAAWEIISADSEQRDWRDKFEEYRVAGVREYWIVNPYVEKVHLFRLDDSGNYAAVEPREGRLESEVIPGFWIRVEWLLGVPHPPVLECLKELGVLP
jgi:Uma2 family endonuclease